MLLAWPTTTLTVTQLKPELVRVPPAPSVPAVYSVDMAFLAGISQNAKWEQKQDGIFSVRS